MTVRRRMPPVVVDTAIAAAAVVIGAAVWPAVLVSLGMLIAAGGLIGLRGRSAWHWTAIGAAVGALVVYGWTFVREPPSNLDGLRNGLSSVLAIGLILGTAFVLPGYLLARGYRRSGDTPEWRDGSGDPDAGPPSSEAPAVRTYVAAGCLILVADVVVILWLVRGLSQLGP